jgi:hypothetical protein
LLQLGKKDVDGRDKPGHDRKTYAAGEGDGDEPLTISR